MSNLLERLSETLDLPAEAVAGTPRVILTGTGRVLIENHRGLTSCTETAVEAEGRPGRIRVRGTGLLLRAMDGEMLLVTGRISGVDLE
ncbi:MAG: sporulation protein [Oscillospiraceae bacterium]|nr:sporulation protein [Oscillospiraceae bacterium]